jgi:hypothetical protein
MNQLQDQYEMTQVQVADKTFMNYKTVAMLEKQAIEKFKQELKNRGIELQDLI